MYKFIRNTITTDFVHYPNVNLSSRVKIQYTRINEACDIKVHRWPKRSLAQMAQLAQNNRIENEEAVETLRYHYERGVQVKH